MLADGSLVPGWYGKIPALGDFASRRLPATFIASWDAWLQTVLDGSRSMLDKSWLDKYLTSPLWCFLLMPGVCGNNAWSGVLMPSVDKVGRYFPLTICRELPRLPASAEELGALLGWIEQLEQPALATLERQHTVEQFEAALDTRSLAFFPIIDEKQRTIILRLAHCADSTANDMKTIASVAAANVTELLARTAAQALADVYSGKSLWWRHTDMDTLFICCRGLPDTEGFVRMLQGTGPAVE